MKKNRKAFGRKPVLLLSAAALLLAGSTVGSTRAALSYFSENYGADVEVSSIGVSLLENGRVISRRDYSHRDDQWTETSGALFEQVLGEDKLQLGKRYQEAVSVRNSGSIDSYVRVTLRKSWNDKEGNKDTALSPDFIELGILEGNGWVVDEAASTPERTVLYYTEILPAGETTPALTDTLTINASLAGKVTETVSRDENGYETITTKYDYDGYSFMLEAEADAVQTHNAQDAVKSAWGVDVKVSQDGRLSLQ